MAFRLASKWIAEQRFTRSRKQHWITKTACAIRTKFTIADANNTICSAHKMQCAKWERKRKKECVLLLPRNWGRAHKNGQQHSTAHVQYGKQTPATKHKNRKIRGRILYVNRILSGTMTSFSVMLIPHPKEYKVRCLCQCKWHRWQSCPNWKWKWCTICSVCLR